MGTADRRGRVGGALRAVARVAAPLVAIALSGADALGDTLDDVTERGRVRCAVAPDLPGFAEADSLGRWRGFDIDVCRAVAAAVLDDDGAIEVLPLVAAARAEALADGRVDVATGETTLPGEHGTGAWIGPLLHDGQTFLAPSARGIRSALELDGGSVCVVGGGVAERMLEDFFVTTGLSVRARPARDAESAFDDYLDGRCDALSGDRTTLAAARSRLERPDRHLLLTETISTRPLGLRVPAGEARWEDAVRWTRHCLVDAAELGIDSANVSARSREKTFAVRALLGLEGRAGAALGLRRDWCASVVVRVGNHTELHARHLGTDTPLGLERGLDAPWTDGGLLYAPPIR